MNDFKSFRAVRRRQRDDLNTVEWAEFRAAQIEKAGGVCWACGDDDEANLQPHHLTYHDGHRAWEYEDHEIHVLCNDCHAAVHHVADLIWVSLLKFQPHELEMILKQIGRAQSDTPTAEICRAFLEAIEP